MKYMYQKKNVQKHNHLIISAQGVFLEKYPVTRKAYLSP